MEPEKERGLIRRRSSTNSYGGSTVNSDRPQEGIREVGSVNSDGSPRATHENGRNVNISQNPRSSVQKEGGGSELRRSLSRRSTRSSGRLVRKPSKVQSQASSVLTRAHRDIILDGEEIITSYHPPAEIRIVAICSNYNFIYTLQDALLPYYKSYKDICNNLAVYPLAVEINVSKSGVTMEEKRNIQLAKKLQCPPEEVNMETQWLNKMQRSFRVMLIQLQSGDGDAGKRATREAQAGGGGGGGGSSVSVGGSSSGAMSRAELLNSIANIVNLRETLDAMGKSHRPILVLVTGETQGSAKAMNTMQCFQPLICLDRVRVCPLFCISDIHVAIHNVFEDIVRSYVLPKIIYRKTLDFEERVKEEEKETPPPSNPEPIKKKKKKKRRRGKKGKKGRGRGRIMAR